MSTSERILAAGIACFARQGYSGTTTRTLAAEAGVNVATLAYHFGGKEGLYRASIDHLYERLLALEPELKPSGSTAERVEQGVRFVYRFAREHRTEVRLLLRHVLEHGNLPTRVREDWALRLLERAELLWAALGLPPRADWKLHLLTFNHLIVRYAISQPEDLTPFVSGANPHQAVEEHLVLLARRALAGE